MCEGGSDGLEITQRQKADENVMAYFKRFWKSAITRPVPPLVGAVSNKLHSIENLTTNPKHAPPSNTMLNPIYAAQQNRVCWMTRLNSHQVYLPSPSFIRA